MWDFDWGGDLFFEKTLQFLKDLFKQWKEEKSRHQLTIVFFSRTCFDDRPRLIHVISIEPLHLLAVIRFFSL